jgi:zinc protease
MRSITALIALSGAALLMYACSGQETPTTAVLLSVPDDPTVSMSIWFDVGSEDDPPGKEGLAYLTGQMLAEAATTELSYQQIIEALYPMAAGYGIRVDKEMTTFIGRVHRDYLEEYFELYADAYLRPAFEKTDFERLRKDALNYVSTTLRYASDEELGKAVLQQFVFEPTRYAHPVVGTIGGLESITLDDVREFYATYFTRPNARIALGGGYPPSLVARLQDTLAELPPGPAPKEAVIEPPSIDGRQVRLVDKEGADASISFGFPIDVRRGEKDFYALWIANSWLGEHRNSSSHLYQVIREARGMNYGDYSYIEAFPQGGQRQFPPANVARNYQLFEVWIRTLPNDWAHFALRAAVRELEQLVEQGMTEDEFELTRSFLRKYVLHFADTTSARLGYAVDDRFYDVDGDGHLARFRRMMDELTLADVNGAIQRHLDPKSMKIAIVTGQASSLAEALASDAPSPVEYPTPKPAEVLEEDQQISTYPLGIAGDAIEIVPLEDVFAD